MAGSKSRTGLCGLLFGAALFAVGNATPAAADSITVTHWGAAFYGAPYAVGMAKGFFKARGVDVTGVLTSTGGGTSVRNTLAGDLPFGEVALAAAVEAINHGEPIRIIGAGVDSVADILWIAKPGSPLHSVQDLRGKKVGFTSPGSVTNMLILMALKAKGMTASDVHLVAAGGIGANLSAVLNGALDAGMTGEPTWSENEGKVQPVFWVKDVLPANMMQTVGVTTIDFAAAIAESWSGGTMPCIAMPRSSVTATSPLVSNFSTAAAGMPMPNTGAPSRRPKKIVPGLAPN